MEFTERDFRNITKVLDSIINRLNKIAITYGDLDRNERIDKARAELGILRTELYYKYKD